MPAPLVDVGSEEESGAGRLAIQVILGAFFVLAVALGVVHSWSGDVTEYGRAIELLGSGHSDRAIVQLEHATRLYPNGVLSQAILGQLFLDSGNPDAAVPPLEQALKLQPGDEEIEHNLALAYLGAGRPAEAETQIAKVFDEEAAKWAPLFIRGVAKGELSDWAGAVTDLRLAVQMYPDWTEAQQDLARFEALQAQDPGSDASVASASRVENAPKESLSGIQIPYAQLVMKSEEWPLYP